MTGARRAGGTIIKTVTGESEGRGEITGTVGAGSVIRRNTGRRRARDIILRRRIVRYRIRTLMPGRTAGSTRIHRAPRSRANVTDR